MRPRTPWWVRLGLLSYSAVAAVLLFTGGPSPNPGGYVSMVNLTPGATIIDALTAGNGNAKLFLLLNALLLVPIGGFMALERLRPVTAMMGIVLVGLCIEIIQFVVPGARSTDVDDLILNSLGGIVAYWITKMILELQAARGQKVT